MTMKFLNETEDFPIPLVVEEYDGPFCIADRFRTMAEEICEAQGMKLPLRKILFMYDKTPYRDGPIGKALAAACLTRDLLYQTTGCMFTRRSFLSITGWPNCWRHSSPTRFTTV